MEEWLTASTLEINLNTFRKNLSLLSEAINTRLLVIVKANAYGHGIEIIGKTCQKFGVDYLGVAQLGELKSLRNAGVRCPILVLGGLFCSDYAEAHALGGDVTVWRPDQLELAASIGRTAGTAVNIHIEVDTGMGRLGVQPRDLVELTHSLAATRWVRVRGVYSHFASADSEDLSSARAQLNRFQDALEILSSQGVTPEVVHIANSPGSLRLPEARFNMVRLGVTAYGLKPTPSFSLPNGVRPIARWVTRMLNVKSLPKSHGVSYGGEFRTPEEMPVGVIPVGYADGFRRYPSSVNQVLLKGIKCKVLGRVCMDFSMIDLRGVPNPTVGDNVTLLGHDGSQIISADDLAKAWGTNNYDVVTNIGSRVERVYDSAIPSS